MSVPGPRSTYEWRAFSIAGIPVTFSIWYLLLVWASVGRAGSIELGVVHLLAVTLSVLVHELGHAWVARGLRLRPRILLHGFGGWCEHDQALRRDDDLRLVAAGPGAGLALGALAWGLGHALRAPPWWLDTFLWDLAWMGLVWSLINLLPILPLDGGSILENLLGRRPRIDAQRITRMVGVVTAIVAGCVALGLGEIGIVFLMFLLAWQNASPLGVVPAMPGMGSGGSPTARLSWKPRPVTIGIAAMIALPALIRAFADIETSMTGWFAGPATLLQPWRLVTWPVVPAGNSLTSLSAAVAVVLTGMGVEQRRGARQTALLAVAAILAAGLASTAAAQVFGGTLAGPIPIALAFVAAWAGLLRDTPLGPSSIPIRPPIVLIAVVVFDLANRWAGRDATNAAADLAAVAVGLAFAAGPRDVYRRIEIWYKLRNPPAIDIRPVKQPEPRPQR